MLGYDASADKVSVARRALGNNLPQAPQAAVGPASIARRPGGGPSRTGMRPQMTRQMGAHPFLRGLNRVISPIVGIDPSSYTSSFGPRRHPVHGGYSNHTGIDLSSPMGTPIVAPANAVLARLRAGDSVYGNQIILGHGNEQETMYGHLASFAPGLKPGSKVRRGDVIGYVGSTGLSTGPHLHWETWNGGQPTNPLTFLGG